MTNVKGLAMPPLTHRLPSSRMSIKAINICRFVLIEVAKSIKRPDETSPSAAIASRISRLLTAKRNFIRESLANRQKRGCRISLALSLSG